MPKEPFAPIPPVEAEGLPPATADNLFIEAFLERRLKRLGRRARAEIIEDLYGAAADLDALGKTVRIRSKDRTAENGLCEKRKQAASLSRALGDMFSRMFVAEEARK